MLKRLSVKGFKSLADVTVDLPQMAVIFGPNAVGKSNLVDAVQTLAALATERTLADAFAMMPRGHPVEAFTLPKEGLPGLLSREESVLRLEAVIARRPIGKGEPWQLDYRVAVAIHPPTGALRVEDEYLTRLSPHPGAPRIEHTGGQVFVRRSNRGRPYTEEPGANHTELSDPRRSGVTYPEFDVARAEFLRWRAYYLDPRSAMRWANPPVEVDDIGPAGEALAPFLFRLKSEFPKNFSAVERALRAAIPSISHLDVELDTRRGTLDIVVVQDGIPYSSRVISEGTLRVLALCAIVSNPEPASLIAFEEPENGVHPRRIESIANLLAQVALDGRSQVLVTTHSPIFASAILRRQRVDPKRVRLFVAGRQAGSTTIKPFQDPGELLQDPVLHEALMAPNEDRVLEEMLLRGWIDG